MRFDRLGANLSFAILVILFPLSNYSQDEFSDENAERPPVNGMFDEDELEPIDDIQIERPTSAPTRNAPVDLDDDLINDVRPITPIRRPDRFIRPSSPSFPSRTSSTGLNSQQQALDFANEVPNPDEKLRMDFIQVDIDEVVKYFAERLRKKFIYDPSILSGKITIISPTEVTVAEAYQAFLSAMEIRGYVVYPSGAYLKIDKVTNARKSPVPLYLASTPDNDAYVTRIITLKYLNVSDIRQAVRDLVSRSGGDVIEHAPTNTLIISDYAANIRRIVRILNVLDVEGFQEQIAVINLQHASASDVARKISEIFPTTGTTPSRTTQTVRGRTTSRNRVDQSVIQKVVADDRTNSLIILGSERGIEQVRKFIEQIDVPVEGGDGQIHVYPLQNVRAEDIAQTLASLTQGSRPVSTAGTGSASRTRNNQASGTTAGSAIPAASLFDGDVRITADPRTNSLVIQSSPRDFETLKEIIRKLDIRRRQVFIESVILETTVGGLSEWKSQVTGPFARTDKLSGEDNKSTGVFGTGNFSNGEELLGTLGGLLGTSAITGLALGFQSGSNVSMTVPKKGGGTEQISVPLLSAILRLAATNSNLNVLSTPHILATANEEATISIGEEIPQIATTQESSSGNPISTYNRIRVATELAITPQINAGDYLTLIIKQKVNQRGGEVIAGQFAVNTREASTTAIVKDGQTIVIGGIMRDETTVSVTKVPFLGDIPVLGWLFKSRRSQNQKVNLLLFLTPHIIRDTADSNDVFFRKLRQRHNLLKEMGMKEKENIPISGLKPEQLELLDEEYVRSLELRPLPERLPDYSENPSSVEPASSNTEDPALTPIDRPSKDPVLIPILPPSGSTPDDEFLEINSDNNEEISPAADSNENSSDSLSPANNLEGLPSLEELDLPPLEDIDVPSLPELENSSSPAPERDIIGSEPPGNE